MLYLYCARYSYYSDTVCIFFMYSTWCINESISSSVSILSSTIVTAPVNHFSLKCYNISRLFAVQSYCWLELYIVYTNQICLISSPYGRHSPTHSSNRSTQGQVMIWHIHQAIVWNNADENNIFHAFAKTLRTLIFLALREIFEIIQFIKQNRLLYMLVIWGWFRNVFWSIILVFSCTNWYV